MRFLCVGNEASVWIRADDVYVVGRAGFTYRLYRLKPWASRSKGTSNKLWYAWGQWPVYDHFD